MLLICHARLVLTGLVLILLSACQSTIEGDGLPSAAALDASFFERLEPLDAEYAGAEEPYRDGVEHFRAGEFQIARRYFQAAVERMPTDATAWIGLAASYDRLSRFDLADYAYTKATRIGGATAQLLNNQGYSRLLRGDSSGARDKLLAAYELDPDNLAIKNNLVLLSSSTQMLQSHRPAYD